MKYYPHVDGLRGMAISLVVLFHADVPGFSGGFIGVDIFFVISGFLITSILANDIRKREFSLLHFYDRRVRRIFPPLIVVYLFSFAAGWIIALPSDLRHYGESLLNSAFFLSNHYFNDQTGYFDTAAHTKPLLHTWSLSVEEQFYLIWPLAFVGLWRLKSPAVRLLIVAAGGTASLVSAELAIAADDQAAAFYLLPMRAWELLIGAALALTIAEIRLSGRAAEGLAALGIAMIGIAAAGLSANSRFPGASALLPCLGAAFLIIAGYSQTPSISRLYVNPPVIFIGLISYSLYLWHWPIFSLWKLSQARVPSSLEAAGLVLISLCLAYLSYRWIERPFRKGWVGLPQKKTLAIGITAMTGCALVGVVTARTDGFPNRFDAHVNEIFALANEKSRGCGRADSPSKSYHGCLLGVRNMAEPPKLVLLGDSHAQHYAPAVDMILKEWNLSGQLLARGGCPPVTNVRQFRGGREWKRTCYIFSAEVEKLLTGSRFDIVVFAMRWEFYTEDEWAETLDSNMPARLVDQIDTQPEDKTSSRRVLERTMRRMIEDLVGQGTQVVLLGQVAPFAADPANCVMRARIRGKADSSCFGSADVVRARLQFSNDFIRRLASEYKGVFAFIASDVTCGEAKCSPFLDGTFIYRDRGHLNLEGGKRMAGYLQQLPPFVDLARIDALLATSSTGLKR